MNRIGPRPAADVDKHLPIPKVDFPAQVRGDGHGQIEHAHEKGLSLLFVQPPLSVWSSRLDGL